MAAGQEMVLKQGFMHKKRERSSTTLRRPWQSGYFVLKKSTAYSSLLLDEYRDASLRIAKQTLFLDNVKHVGAVNTSKSKQYAFQVVVLGRSPLLFACDNELLRSEWIGVFSKYTDESINSSLLSRISPEGGPSAVARQPQLQQAHSAYIDSKVEDANPKSSTSGFEVAIQSTPLATVNNLQGSYILRITKSRIFLQQLDRKEDVLSWPLTQLRGFKSQPEQQQIVLETGRRCHFGKGRLTLKTKHCEPIIQDIREAVSWQDGKKALLDISSGSSSESDAEMVHKVASRSRSDQQCNVTVSVRPRRTHSERIFSQVALGRSSAHKSACQTASISPTSFINTNSLKIPVNDQEECSEEVFTFEEKSSASIADKQTGKTNWKTSHTFSKTMIESKSENDFSSGENTVDDANAHPYIDIIADDEAEKPLTSDQASTLLAQVVADLTEPQKKLYFIKSNSTGGIQSKEPELTEIRRSSEPAVGVVDFNMSLTLDSDTQDGQTIASRKFRLEKINEVSFTDTADADKGSNHRNVAILTAHNDVVASKERVERPRSFSEMVSPTEKGSPILNKFKKRSRTTLCSPNVGSSLTDLSPNGLSHKHKGLRPTLSHSSTASVSHQLSRDPLSYGFKSGSGKIPSFPKRSVVKAVETVGGLDSSRTKLNMSPLPKEFHSPGIPNTDDETMRSIPDSQPRSGQHPANLPPRPPKDSDVKAWKKQSVNHGLPPPLPERIPSPTGCLLSPREKGPSALSHGYTDSGNRVYTNTPPKVQPRTPNAQPLSASTLSSSTEMINPPPRPPKPGRTSFSNKKSDMNTSPPAISFRKSEKRAECYTWDIDYNGTHDNLKDNSPQLDRVKNPIVTVTPPRSPIPQRSMKQSQLRGLSFSESDLVDVLAGQLQMTSGISSSFHSADTSTGHKNFR